MKTFVLENQLAQSSTKSSSSQVFKSSVLKIGASIIVLLTIIISCMYIHPLIVFSLVGVLAIGMAINSTYKELKLIDYALGNELVEDADINAFIEDFDSV